MRSLGISLEPDGFTYALVEGTAKKHTLKLVGGGSFAPLDPEPTRALGRAISAGLKKVGKVDRTVLTLPSGGTVLREISLPFSDRDKVEKVLKFEIE